MVNRRRVRLLEKLHRLFGRNWRSRGDLFDDHSPLGVIFPLSELHKTGACVKERDGRLYSFLFMRKAKRRNTQDTKERERTFISMHRIRRGIFIFSRHLNFFFCYIKLEYFLVASLSLPTFSLCYKIFLFNFSTGESVTFLFIALL